MFSGAETSRAYQSGEPIRDHWNNFLVPVLMSDYRSQGKGRHGVTGRERIAAVEELSLSSVSQRPLALCGEFENFEHHQPINQGFGAE